MKPSELKVKDEHLHLSNIIRKYESNDVGDARTFFLYLRNNLAKMKFVISFDSEENMFSYLCKYIFDVKLTLAYYLCIFDIKDNQKEYKQIARDIMDIIYIVCKEDLDVSMKTMGLMGNGDKIIHNEISQTYWYIDEGMKLVLSEKSKISDEINRLVEIPNYLDRQVETLHYFLTVIECVIKFLASTCYISWMGERFSIIEKQEKMHISMNKQFLNKEIDENVRPRKV